MAPQPRTPWVLPPFPPYSQGARGRARPGLRATIVMATQDSGEWQGPGFKPRPCRMCWVTLGKGRSAFEPE